MQSYLAVAVGNSWTGEETADSLQTVRSNRMLFEELRAVRRTCAQFFRAGTQQAGCPFKFLHAGRRKKLRAVSKTARSSF